ncbi:amidohydrolase family protein [Nonomuraea africana]|uniref:TIM-barrel fold metal-dependent hydrolase n=1 Tax=Nonomuraea africana TaxID=46171 RepID=A0ABR9KCM6_9ACTN|nr:amidohydrolase family protein [Nonomuraea africana]MBE1559749.1 putative TIM-barrel fold metal-dependent hydrolase [Nonomuraea africana]
MDRQGIAAAILSLTTPGAYLGDGSDAARVARQSNEYAARLVTDHPGRFGFFATLTLPDVKAAVTEASYALGELAADGVMLLANSDGRYLGDPAFDPLMALLDELSAVVFVHPAQLPGPVAEGIPPFAADFLLDTTRAAFTLVKHDVPRRLPNIRFILAHAGGFVPYAAHRLALTVFGETGRDLNQVLGDLRGFYFDTALSASPVLQGFARPGHILYGSDWPFAPEPAVAYFTTWADDAAINHRNARELFKERFDA